MKKTLITVFTEWLRYALYGTVVGSISFMNLMLLAGVLNYIDPPVGLAEIVFFTWNAILISLRQGAMMGFLFGSMVYAFTRLLLSPARFKSRAGK